MQYYQHNKYDYTYTEYVKNLLDAEIKEFSELRDYYNVKRTQRQVLIKSNLFTMASNAFFERVSRHYGNNKKKIYSLTRIYLKEQLGQDYKKIVGILFDFRDEYKFKKHTKEYRLKKKVVEIFEKAFIDSIRRHTLLDGFGKKVSANILKGNAVNKGVINQEGNISSKKSFIVEQKLYIPNQVKINIDRLTDAWKMYGELKYYQLGRKKLSSRTQRVLKSAGVNFKGWTPYKVEKWEKIVNELIVRSNTAPFEYGHIFQLYDERQMGGRLYSQGAYGLQNLPKHIRHIIFSKLGYYDYDMVNCHYTILAQLNKLYGGGALLSVNDYNNNVSKTRKQIAKDTGIEISIVKQLMIGVVYGMSLDYNRKYWHPRKRKKVESKLMETLRNTYGDNNTAVSLASSFVNNTLVKNIYGDVRSASDVILKSVNKTGVGDRQFLENHYGKKIKLSVMGSNNKLIKLSRGQQLSHILQGLEAFMMSEIISESNKDTNTEYLVPYHDGWICKGSINKKYYENHLTNATMRRLSEYDGKEHKEGLEIKISGGSIDDPYKKV